MNITQRTTTGPRRGANRPLTPDEINELRRIDPALSIPGARTAENAASRDHAHQTLIKFFEDGVSIDALAAAMPGRDRNNVNQHLMTARRHGFGTGTRRFIPRPPRTAPQRIRTTRDLTQAEQAALQDAYDTLPDAPGAGRDWNTAQGQDLIQKIQDMLDTHPRARQSEIAAALGVSRQALNQRLQPPTAA